MFDLRSFGLTDILESSSEIRRLGRGASSMEEAARAVVRYLYSQLIDKDTDQPGLALVRLYKTHRFDELEPELQAFARRLSPRSQVAPDAACLTLLASAGDEPAWNDRRRSNGHAAIPLQDVAGVARLPMVYQLIRQLGLEDRHVVRPDPDHFAVAGGQPGGVFYVAEAKGTDSVPAQDFVERYGIRSVIGFGSLLPSGYVFAVVMFAKVPVSRDTAEAFAPLAFATQLALLPFVERRLFDSDPPDVAVDFGRELRMARAEAAALGHLLETRHHVVAEQASRLELARSEAEDRAEALARSQRRLEASEATKAAILDAALDAIITMDDSGRIVDFNPAAEQMFGYPREDASGRLLADVIVPSRFRAAHATGLERLKQTGEGPILGRRIEIVAVRADGTEFPVELAVAAVDAGGVRLFSGHVRDITVRIEAEEALRAAGRRYADIARRLQASLLPPDLPTIPRAELASVYHPGDEGLDVGGDFYDVFELGDGRWGIVLGDVMGKGADAAAMTALARHTVRAAAIRSPDATEVLQVLNEALYRHDPDRFCTAVFAFLDLSVGAELTVASGGHPPPLLRRAGQVATIGTPGPLVGPFPDWTGTTARVLLDPGDLLLVYSDGLTESRRGPEEFGLERLVEALSMTGEADAAGTVETVVSAATTFATVKSDDTAALALRMLPEP